MNPAEITVKILDDLAPYRDPKRVDVAEWYFPTAMTVWGVTTPDMREVLKQHRKIFRQEPPDRALAIVFAILDRNIFEARHLAYELLAGHAEASAGLNEALLRRLGRGMDNWASVDCFSVLLSGPAWRRGQITDAHVLRWARDPNVWWRRCALVSTVPLNLKSRGGHGDTPRTMRLCQALVDDGHDMVQKALSWALRELSKRDPASVQAFLDDHGDRVAARVRREVQRKLDTGRKNPKAK